MLAACGHPVTEVEAIAYTCAIAEYARGFSTPNPPVGAVVVDTQGILVGMGITQPPGGRHAEREALAMAGERAQGSTLYVTLEPCNTWGRTGPCTEAIIRAGVAQVIYGASDITSAGGGENTLCQAGIDCFHDIRLSRSNGLHAWLHKQHYHRPRITAKIAATLDGFSAAPDGTSQWITGEESRKEAHLERSRVDAILVGTGTVRADNPRLNARTEDGELYDHQPLRIVVGNTTYEGEEPTDDPRIGILPVGSTLCAADGTQQPLALAPALHLRTQSWDDIIDILSTHALNDVLIEGGPHLVGDAIMNGIPDRIIFYQAPLFLGAGLPAVCSPQTTTLTDAQRYVFCDKTRLGDDLRIVLEKMGKDREHDSTKGSA